VANLADEDMLYSGEFQNITVTQRHFLLGFVHSSNRSIIFDSRTEESNESKDRTWRRWLSFCAEAGRSHDPFLNQLSPDGQELLVRSFITCLQMAQWEKGSGVIKGLCKKPMVASTVHEATGHLATTFRDNHKQSPLHIEGSS
jgi:hypothetical protein